MFVGHYGISFAAKALQPSLPLSGLMVSTQVLDLVWSTLVLLGVEKMRITPKFTATNDIDLYYMPYSHGLPAALGWSALTGGMTYYVLPNCSLISAVVMAAVCFSHWLLDVLVHPRDLPLIGNRYKIGLGLWNYRGLTLAIELGILFAGAGLYVATLPPGSSGLGWLALSLAVGLAVLHTATIFGPPPKSVSAFAGGALGAYVLVVAVWVGCERLLVN
jgi:hypothetical protein